MKTWSTPSLETLDVRDSTQLNYPPGAADNTAASDSYCPNSGDPVPPDGFCLS